MTINLRIVSIAVMVATGMIGAVQMAGPESLGISSVAIRWLGILAAGLGILQGVLPRVQGPTTDPQTLTDRIRALPEHDRKLVEQNLADDAIQDRAEELRREFPNGPAVNRG